MNFKKLNDFFFLQKIIKQDLKKKVLCCFLLGVSVNSFAIDSVFEQSYDVSLSFEKAQVEKVLESISKQTGIKLAYNNKEVNIKKNVSVKIQTTDIEEALIAVLGSEYSFLQVDDYIAIAKKQETSSNIAGIANNGERSLVIQGRVMEDREPPVSLPGVNVAIKGTTIGTITDENGYFKLKAKKMMLSNLCLLGLSLKNI